VGTSSVSVGTSSVSVGTSSVSTSSSSVSSTGSGGAAGWNVSSSDATGGMGGLGGSSAGGRGGAGGGCQGPYCCDPNVWPFLAPVPITAPTCSDFDSDVSPTGIHCVMPGGVWFIDTDMMGTPANHSPVVIEPCGTSGSGLHFKGAGHTLWGAEVATTVVSQTQPVDASPFSGMSFVMKSITPVPLIFKVQNSYSQPLCGQCQEFMSQPGLECYSGYIKVISVAPNDAAPIVVQWSDLTQQTWGYRPPGSAVFNPRDLIAVAFAFDQNVDFDVCIDDVRFIR
jgi:hypothetical protein